MKVGIVGAGAIGLTLGAELANVHDVVVLARRAEVPLTETVLRLVRARERRP
jgi:ketopantoate reductase